MFEKFLTIAKQLNEVGITPLLMGSLGLEFVSNRSWDVRDIDIHVPGDPRGWSTPDEQRILQFDLILAKMEQLGYQLIDRHEHEFIRQDTHVEFGVANTLQEFAGVDIKEVPLVEVDGASFFVPTLHQFLAIYRASSRDSYRNDQNNDKDFAKIAYLETVLAEDDTANDTLDDTLDDTSKNR